ncbi:GBF-interacting protein 1-like isoform X5 [Canna indica]|uniref:GBF-interacting protein 1-like isoform X5 n=1 Tax=Canna indica TaxID=4628 RepID=A0AAQ3KK02_9LILI|nr:GBF-interacting protein 1-like isoform X5 [Canna indica]
MNKGDGSRFMIPASVRRTIQNIREIAGNHSDEEVYTMLKECAMDPNEAAQKLLLQDTFHEVKRKRDKKKENMREHANPGWRPGSLGRGKRGGRQNHYSHNLSNDGDGRNLNSRKENAVNQGLNKGVHNAIGTEKKPTTSISSTVPDILNPPSKADILLSSQGCSSQVSDDDGITSSEGTYSYNKDHVSAAEFVIPSLDAHNPGKMATIKHVIQSQETVIEMTVNNVSSHDVVDPEFSSLRDKGSTEVDSSYGEIQVKLEGFETNKVSFTSQVPYSSSYRGPMVNRSLSTHDNHSPQLVGSQEVVSNKEWKPKSTNMSSTQASGIFGHSNVPMMGDTVSQSITVPPSCLVDSEETTWKIEKKLDELKLPTRQHVFIPTHLQVPDYERYGLSFGSFDASFNFNMALANDHASDVSTAQLSGSTNHIEENVEQPSSCASSAAEETDDSDYIHSPIQIPETYSSREAEISSISTMEEHDQTKQDPILALDPKDSVVPSVPSNSTVGLVPQVPQIHSAPSEVSGSFVVSTAGPTVATQMVVAMQGPALLQQPVPIFRQPAGVHLSHYPIPYSQYYSPFFAPPTVHPFPSNATFPQQPPIGSMYPLGGAAAAAPVRFSPQYKSGTNVGNSPPFGMPMAYAAYNSVPTGYTPIVSSSESTGNQDLNSSQFKENNIYRSEQQSEGSGLWIPAAGQDISGLQAGSFCGIPPQRQYMSFAPAQSHGAFSPIYHSSPAMAAAALHPFFQQSQSATGATEMGSPPAGICQQTQHAQINWNNNY